MQDDDRSSVLKRASDGFLPRPVTRRLFHPWARVGPAHLNGWTAVHAASGALAGGVVGVDLGTWLWWHTAWEVFQWWAGDNAPDSAETWVDVPLDTGAAALGWWLTQ